MLLVASHVIPMEGSPLSPGAIRISGERIVEIGDPAGLRPVAGEEILELAETVLTPGLVNAHCHLELTALGPLDILTGRSTAPPFVDWVRDLIRKKNALTPAAMTAGIRRGIDHLLASGVTAVGDHVSFNTEYRPIIESALKGRLFGEVLGILPEVCADIYRSLREMAGRVNDASDRFRMSVTPHSVHAVHPDTLKEIARTEPGPFSIHLAESREEADYFGKQSGPLIDLIAERGLTSLHKGASAIAYLKKSGFPLSRTTAIHGNYLADAELGQLIEMKIPLVHCPGSHAYFGHRSFPLRGHLDHGLSIGIGTDSIASNTGLDFLLELKRIRETHRSVAPREILTMATLGGARALRMEKEIGSLAPGKKADIAGFPLKKGLSAEESVIAADCATFLMIDGKIVQS